MKSARFALSVALAAVLLPATAYAQQTENQPVGLIKAIYGQYISLKNGTRTPNQYTKGWYSQRIRTKIVALEKACKNRQDMCWPDADFLVEGQDYDIKGLAVRELSRQGDKATVEAKFRNFKDPRTMVFSMVSENGKWVIDEMTSKSSGSKLSEILQAEPPSR